MQIKPMLAAKLTKPENLTYPKVISPKLDGIRCLAFNGIAYTRSLKPVRNYHVQFLFQKNRLHGFDGELIVGSPTSPDCIRNTTSGVMSFDGVPEFKYYIFDNWERTVEWQSINIKPKFLPDFCELLEHEDVFSYEDILKSTDKYLSEGYEGAMLRDPKGFYKQGRAAEREQTLIKIKKFVDIEVKIVGFDEEMENTNPAIKDNLGHSKRSKHSANMVRKNRLGALVCSHPDFTDWFPVGSGLDHATKEYIWANRNDFYGKYAKIKYFEHGTMDAPRHPVFICMRDEDDMSQS